VRACVCEREGWEREREREEREEGEGKRGREGGRLWGCGVGGLGGWGGGGERRESEVHAKSLWLKKTWVDKHVGFRPS
jgi:hypothetical protein